MFGLFKSPPFVDPALGELRRSGGRWRGTLQLDGAPVRLVLAGGRAAPDPDALEMAKGLPAEFESLKATIGAELFEHYAPYAEAVAAGEEEAVEPMPSIDGPAGVWAHATAEFALVAPRDGVEIGYRVAWDEEHTLGARFQGGRFLELNGSVLAP